MAERGLGPSPTNSHSRALSCPSWQKEDQAPTTGKVSVVMDGLQQCQLRLHSKG